MNKKILYGVVTLIIIKIILYITMMIYCSSQIRIIESSLEDGGAWHSGKYMVISEGYSKTYIYKNKNPFAILDTIRGIKSFGIFDEIEIMYVVNKATKDIMTNKIK